MSAGSNRSVPKGGAAVGGAAVDAGVAVGDVAAIVIGGGVVNGVAVCDGAVAIDGAVGGDGATVGDGPALTQPAASAVSKTIRMVAITAISLPYYNHSNESWRNFMSAIETWGEMVRLEHAQSDRMRGVRPADHWTQCAPQFKADPYRSGDTLVEALRAHLRPDDTLLDVGAGGGRLALPLALACQSVTAVEPSPSMCAVLRETAHEYGIANVSIVAAGWPEAAVAPADVTLCSHVVYVIEHIAPFVRKLHSHARRLALAVLFQSPPQSQIYALWEQAHGEKRHPLPSLPEFLPVLDELGIQPEVTELDAPPPRGFDSIAEARESIASRLYVTPGTAAMGRLERALDDSLHESDGVWQVEGTQPLRPCIVAWQTAGR